jgi:hypothetical protein
MKNVKYSASVQSAANRFLAGYNLTLEKLTEPQQKQVVIYIRAIRWWPWLLLCFLAIMLVFGYGVMAQYNQMQDFIGKAVIISNSGTEIDWQKISRFSLEHGFITGVYALTAVYMVLLTIFVPMNIHSQKRLLDAFLQALAPKSINESHKQD